MDILKISFDFDGTLTLIPMQKLAKALVAAGHDVWILTSRSNGSEYNANREPIILNKDLYELAAELGIPKENVIFTPMENKCVHVEKHQFDMHFENDPMDVDFINMDYEGNKGILVGWKIPRGSYYDVG